MLSAATTLFLRDGYDQTSIDAILEQSGGSKGTLYSYFPTKEDLFRAVIDSILHYKPSVPLDTGREVRQMLIEFSVDRLHVIFSAHHRAALRVIIAERERFPDLALLYYERGPQRGHKALVDYLAALKQANSLGIDDPDDAAEFFIGMLMHKWYKELLLLGIPTPSDEALERRAEQVVGRFLEGFHSRKH